MEGSWYAKLGLANPRLPYEDVVSNHEELCNAAPSRKSMKPIAG
jgi:hypothetical protein